MSSSSSSARVVRASVGPEPSLAELVAEVADPRAGCVATFVGWVRDHDHGRSVERLEYSAHPSASARLADLAAEVASGPGLVAISVQHATGDLRIGDVAVVAAVAAEHRGQAFEACHLLVDRLKAEVPIWKHQVFTDGDDEWVGIP
ncbi:molybdopterin synthase subunit MoaE [Austwickia chelonae]|uniref:molybdenum cofactor biosynthesis protein MoaE n=1 Tax=Austwickia chelonae TaxID=100225 RepID=UPI0002EB0FD1|nr:molybdenum cofactor biosynthesis protein MoaE [Austwickia chelonae]SEW00856.1 molybdopterin synthase subunit MoaE [Austwickia chelonae]